MKREPLERAFSIPCCNIIRVSPDKKVENLGCIKNERRKNVDEQNHVFGCTAYPLCQLLSILSLKHLPFSRPPIDVYFE